MITRNKNIFSHILVAEYKSISTAIDECIIRMILTQHHCLLWIYDIGFSCLDSKLKLFITFWVHLKYVPFCILYRCVSKCSKLSFNNTEHTINPNLTSLVCLFLFLTIEFLITPYNNSPTAPPPQNITLYNDLSYFQILFRTTELY